MATRRSSAVAELVLLLVLLSSPAGAQKDEPSKPGAPAEKGAKVIAAADTANSAASEGRDRSPVIAPAVPEPPLAAHTVESARAPAWWTAGFQSTYVLQRKGAFNAPYTGPNSLTTAAETGYTLTGTVFLGVRPWGGTELFFNPETIQSQSISHLSGLGGLSNGENQKGGGPVPTLYRARAFLRQTIGLGGEQSTIESSPNQFGGAVANRRLVITAGNLSWVDVFDNNAYAHDPRTQFLNWALMSYGAFDYAADVRGYTWGITLELDDDSWAFRLGRFAQPIESNGLDLDFNLWNHYGDTLEIEHSHSLFGQPGRARLAGFHNFTRMGSFREALQHAASTGSTPDVASVRRDQSKFGCGLSLEQTLWSDLGIFARYSFNDGDTETYAYAEIESSLSAGVSIKGRPWHREGDSLAVAWVENGISADHVDYLRAGGLGFLIGDGRLDRYRSEEILEAYYSFNAFRGLWFTLDAQHIRNPAYNADRGPLNIFSVRVHIEM